MPAGALAGIAEGVHEARAAILATIRADPDREWRPADLMSAAPGDLSDSKKLIAFWNLVKDAELVVDERLVVHLT